MSQSTDTTLLHQSIPPKKFRLRWQNILGIMLGTAIFSFGINTFNIANNLSEGGFTGIALLLKYIFNINPAITNLALNIPLFIIGYRQLGKSTMIYTIIGTLFVSLFLWIFEGIAYPMPDHLILAALYAGVFVGIGLGIVFRFGGTTGGSDIVARIVNKHKGISMGKVLLMFDIFVIALSTIYLDLTYAMYTMVAIYTGTRVIDFVLEGASLAKATMIISEQAPAISSTITQRMGRGTTLLKGRGGYTGSEKEVLYCVVPRGELILLRNLVHEVDPYAFIVVSDAREVFGEGFTLDENKQPLKG
ncbi:YitT family protein [Rubeoparvulum massiliense]|uniref:YitT family protein n=1 Tax=Rubeoparvulum massiliense TaxID=1631346 RepID=UPI00065E9994|nr:YitT family protein [Rubeoparvulum massiliense]